MSKAARAAEPPVRRRRYQSTSRDDQKRESRQRILECALRHFSERGFDAASLRDIAGDAGVTHALVRAHFGGKEELWRATIDYLFERQEQAMDFSAYSRLERLDAQDVRRFIHDFVALCAANPENVRIMFRETIGSLNDRTRWLIDHHIERVTRPLVRLLGRAMHDGVIVEMPIHTLVYVIASLSQNIFALKAETEYRFGVDITTPEEVSNHADVICRLILKES
ncbi:TetR/AcrR family transcriptional regulator [Methylobacterium sp. Gmos1]